jgi:Flp pilus assembly protein TadG
VLLNRFCRDQNGGAAVMFAMVAVPLIAVMGAAVDYGRAAAIRTSMQAAADATALAISSQAADQTPAQVQTSAQSFFDAEFHRADAQNLSFTALYSKDDGGSHVDITVTADVTTNFVGMIGMPVMSVGVSSRSTWGQRRLRVALALDNTGSMAKNGKMTALKTAATNLITQLQQVAKNDGDVYVSIVPFATDVNIGTGSATALWIDWSNWSAQGSIEQNLTCNSSTCGLPNHSAWNGCVMDRQQPNDTTNVTPNGSINTMFPADQAASCPTALMPLSYDWTALKNKISAMQPAGNTNQTIGLAWAWQSLSQGAPLNAPDEDQNYTYQRVIILLSDGQNTQNRFSSTQSKIDARMELACANAKAAGVTIYTVLVLAGNSSVLQDCASDKTKYFALSSADQIITTFQTIGTSLSKLRIAK